jgi:hypothetical protein
MQLIRLAVVGAALSLSGCADVLQSYASQIVGPPATRPRVQPIALDCTSMASASGFFGYDTNTSDFSRLIAVPTAKQSADQRCEWKEGTRDAEFGYTSTLAEDQEPWTIEQAIR